ncbi:hypothetical protein OCV51_13045 [Faecalicatena acetigenes]|uniref:Uncharacterized protein n=1 Tax=Faecalicatena acetigenes TaxID=2981790 RepID=A0ABT2TE48_9FIRM|nr:hypothetical protein [Faecalicatena acetigenes]MCU6748568.1 hypothetical protein [Faecalicatena acetigenes]SCI51435.1 Uncharacterised protein [uncultured Clostridium sp.]
MTKQTKKLKRQIGSDRICAVWTTVSAYMNFYEDWVRTCCRISRNKNNPNRKLLKRWKN